MSQAQKNNAKPNLVELECREQQIHKVTVYNDRAEVVRVVKTDIQAGINEIHIKNVTNCLVKDSIRVDGLGDVLIHEVQTVNKPVMEEEKDNSKVAEIRSRRDAQRKEVARIKGRQNALKKKELALENLISQLGSKFESDSAVNNIEKLFTFHDSETEIVRETLLEVEESLVQAEKKLNKLELEFRKATKSDLNYQYATTFVIALESKHDGKIQLYLTYQVLKASWFPTYDIRVDTYSSGPMMRMTYFGQISQSTGEDWLEVPITLSTSQPSLGGNIPELGTLEVKFLQAASTPAVQHSRTLNLGRLQRGVQEKFEVDTSIDSGSSASIKKFEHAVARDVKDQVLSTEFTISRPGVVPSGGDVHKVTIGMISMVPQLSHECVPRKSSSVFLAASMMNDSPFPLLRGEASIFLNNSFVNKVDLKSVSPGEKFTCSLGVDPGIKVVYKPVKTYHEKSGMISKWSLVNTEQEITIRNTRKSAIVLTIKEQIPRSVEDKIKVRLLHPVNYVALDKEPTHVAWMDANEQQGVRLTKANNLEWTVQMHDGQVLDLVVKYSIEHPSDQTLSYLESL